MKFNEAPIDSGRITDLIADALQREHETEVIFFLNPEIPDARVKQIRVAGRAAGRRIGRSVRTWASRPDQREDRMISILINDLTEEELEGGQRRMIREHGTRAH